MNGVQDMSQNVLNQGVIIKFGGLEYLPKYVGNPHFYQAPKSNCFIAALAIETHESLFHI